MLERNSNILQLKPHIFLKMTQNEWQDWQDGTNNLILQTNSNNLKNLHNNVNFSANKQWIPQICPYYRVKIN